MRDGHPRRRGPAHESAYKLGPSLKVSIRVLLELRPRDRCREPLARPSRDNRLFALEYKRWLCDVRKEITYVHCLRQSRVSKTHAGIHPCGRGLRKGIKPALLRLVEAAEDAKHRLHVDIPVRLGQTRSNPLVRRIV